MAKIRGVIFDVDGTLIDSNDAHARAWVEALAEFGVEVEYDAARRLIGMGGDKLLPELAGIEEASTLGREVSARRSALFTARYLPTLVPLPGARALVERLRGDGLEVGIASSAKGDELKRFLRVAGVEDLISDTTSSSDAENSKPDPDIVVAALAKLGLAPEEVLMVGDTPYDVEAAAGAGVGVVAVRSGGWGDEALAGALAVYDDPADLLARLDESPFARS